MTPEHGPAPAAPAFDREPDLETLLVGIDRPRLQALLEALLGTTLRLRAPGGRVVFGDPGAGLPRRTPVCYQIETVAWLETPGEGEAAEAAAALLELLLAGAGRYQMAAALHQEVVQADYEELRQRHQALQASEARYRALSAQLEQRVAQQVRTIESAQRRLYQTEQAAAVGRLAAGVAHEINNPLGFIRSNLTTAQGYVQALAAFGRRLAGAAPQAAGEAWEAGGFEEMLADFTALLHESLEGLEHMAAVVRDLKAFSNVDREEVAVIDLNDCLHRVCRLARGEIGPGAVVTFTPGPLPAIRCRPAHLAQMFLNLLRNAAQAVSGGGRIEVSAHREGEQACVCIRDDGAGIPAAVLDRIFEPFFTTREVGQGTGLGLTVSRDIARAHGGGITVDSQEGEGTTVTVRLPLHGPEADPEVGPEVGPGADPDPAAQDPVTGVDPG